MNKLFATAVALATLSTAAAACPNVSAPGVANYSTNGQDLYSPNSYSVAAGGQASLSSCGFNGTGYVISQPDFEFQLSGMESYGRLNLRVDSSCDSVLLVNDAAGNWHFNDDSNGNLDPSIDIRSPASGVYDIWVGTYNGDICNATLTLETF